MNTSGRNRLGKLIAGAGALASALALAGCGEKPAAPADGSAAARPLAKVILQTDWYAQPEHGGFYQALVKGYYREAGLEVEIRQGSPSTRPQQVVAAEQADFGIGRSDDVVIYVSRGVPLVMVGALMQRDPQGIMFHQESGIRGFADLDRRNIMAVPGSNFIPIMERKFGIKVSITPSDYGMIRFVADKKFVQQCFITNEPFYVRQQGADVGVLLLSEIGFAPYRVWYSSRSFIAKNPEVARAFTAASIRGWREYIDGDRTEADARIGALNRQMTPEFIAFAVRAMKEHRLVNGDPAKGEAIGQLDPARVTDQLKQLAELGLLTRPVTLAEVFDDRFLPDDVRAKPAPDRLDDGARPKEVSAAPRSGAAHSECPPP